MQYKPEAVIASAIVVVMLSAFGTLTAFATPSPNGPGQPGACTLGAKCSASPVGMAGGTTCGSTGATVTPGNSGPTGSSQSPFNPSATTGPNGAGAGGQYANPGTSQMHSNNPQSTGQYDISCFQQTQNHP